MRSNQSVPEAELFLQMIGERADLVLHRTHQPDIDHVTGHCSFPGTTANPITSWGREKNYPLRNQQPGQTGPAGLA